MGGYSTFHNWGDISDFTLPRAFASRAGSPCLPLSIFSHPTKTRSPLNVNSVHGLSGVKSFPLHFAPSKYQLVHPPDQAYVPL